MNSGRATTRPTQARAYAMGLFLLFPADGHPPVHVTHWGHRPMHSRAALAMIGASVWICDLNKLSAADKAHFRPEHHRLQKIREVTAFGDLLPAGRPAPNIFRRVLLLCRPTKSRRLFLLQLKT